MPVIQRAPSLQTSCVGPSTPASRRPLCGRATGDVAKHKAPSELSGAMSHGTSSNSQRNHRNHPVKERRTACPLTEKFPRPSRTTSKGPKQGQTLRTVGQETSHSGSEATGTVLCHHMNVRLTRVPCNPKRLSVVELVLRQPVHAQEVTVRV